MFEDVGIYRNEQGMRDAIRSWRSCGNISGASGSRTPGGIFNTSLLNAWELSNMLQVAEVWPSRGEPQESRGGHSREDFPRRDDRTAETHTGPRVNGKVEIGYNP